MTPYSLVGNYQCFKETHCLEIPPGKIRNNLPDCTVSLRRSQYESPPLLPYILL
jgi:hypothetical protein